MIEGLCAIGVYGEVRSFVDPFYLVNDLFMRMEKKTKKKSKKDSFERETVLLGTQQTINN